MTFSTAFGAWFTLGSVVVGVVVVTGAKVVVVLTLTHSLNTTWADSSGDKPAHDGLAPFGREVVRELNRLADFQQKPDPCLDAKSALITPVRDRFAFDMLERPEMFIRLASL